MGKNEMLPKMSLRQVVASAKPMLGEQPLPQESDAVGDPGFQVRDKVEDQTTSSH